MLTKLRSCLTYANVMATVAISVATERTSYAAATGSIDTRRLGRRRTMPGHRSRARPSRRAARMTANRDRLAMSTRPTRSAWPAAIALLTAAFALAPTSAKAAFGPLSEDLRLSFMGPDGTASYGADHPSVAYNPTANEYLVVWQGDDNTAPLVQNEIEVFAQRLSGSGAPLGERIRVSEQGADGNPAYYADRPSVAYNEAANEYLVAWTGVTGTSKEFEIWAQRLSAAGAEVGVDDFQISDMGPDLNAGYGAFAASVAANPSANEYFVVWHGTDNIPPLVAGEFEIFGQRLTAGGTQTGTNDVRISEQGANGIPSSVAVEPSVAYHAAANEYLVAWRGEIGTSDEFEIWTQRLSAAGAEVGANDLQISDMGPSSQSYDARNPRVAANPTANEYLVVWSGDNNIGPPVDNFGQRLTAAGAQTGTNDFRISAQAAGPNLGSGIYDPSVAHDPGANEYLVAWSGEIGSSGEYEIRAQRLSAEGAQVGGSDFQVSDMGPSSNENFDAAFPSVAANPTAGEYLVVWYGDDTTDDEFEVFGRRLGMLPAPPAAAGGPAPTRGGGVGGSDATPPSFVGAAKAVPPVFAVGSAHRPGRALRSARRKDKRGTTFRYMLSEAARVVFAIERRRDGRRVGGRCSKRTRANRGNRSCTRYARIGTFVQRARAGRNGKPFAGRVASRRLMPGRYRATLVATDAAGNASTPKHVAFRVMKP